MLRNKSAFVSDPQVSLQPVHQLIARGQFHRLGQVAERVEWMAFGILPTLGYFLKIAPYIP